MTDFTTIDVQVQIDHQRIEDLLAGAFEGGSNYWCRVEELVRGPEQTKNESRYIDYLISSGSILLRDVEDEEETEWVLDMNRTRNGLARLALDEERHWDDFQKENDDADTADIFLQLCLFGEVVYG